MTKCESKTCGREGCEKPVPPRRPGKGRPARYCSDACSHAMSRRGVFVNERAGRDEGPDVPLNGWTEELAQARMERLIIDGLREGVLVEALGERFGVSPRVVRTVAAQHKVSVQHQGARNPPFGTPVW